MKLTDDEVIELGDRALALLTSETFRLAISKLGDDYADNILLSKPNEKMVREENYYLHKALNELVAQLDAFVAAKEEVEKRLQSEDDE